MNFEEKEPQWLFEMTFKATNSEANELHLEMLTWPEFVEYDSHSSALAHTTSTDFAETTKRCRELTKMQIQLKRRIYKALVERGFV